MEDDPWLLPAPALVVREAGEDLLQRQIESCSGADRAVVPFRTSQWG